MRVYTIFCTHLLFFFRGYHILQAIIICCVQPLNFCVQISLFWAQSPYFTLPYPTFPSLPIYNILPLSYFLFTSFPFSSLIFPLFPPLHVLLLPFTSHLFLFFLYSFPSLSFPSIVSPSLFLPSFPLSLLSCFFSLHSFPFTSFFVSLPIPSHHSSFPSLSVRSVSSPSLPSPLFSSSPASLSSSYLLIPLRSCFECMFSVILRAHSLHFAHTHSQSCVRCFRLILRARFFFCVHSVPSVCEQ